MPQKLKINPILDTDSYKLSHWVQYPPNTEYVYTYLMSRGGFWQNTLFFGLQYTLKAYFEGKVFAKKDVHEAAACVLQAFGNGEVFNFNGWMRLLEKHGGKLPLRIPCGQGRHRGPHQERLDDHSRIPTRNSRG